MRLSYILLDLQVGTTWKKISSASWTFARHCKYVALTNSKKMNFRVLAFLQSESYENWLSIDRSSNLRWKKIYDIKLQLMIRLI